ncbi:MAG TPA: hypothetical protein VJT32_05285 [bacterium]|nr:hypothetical protein [bacterium]
MMLLGDRVALVTGGGVRGLGCAITARARPAFGSARATRIAAVGKASKDLRPAVAERLEAQ